jgi:hypothetical protein
MDLLHNVRQRIKSDALKLAWWTAKDIDLARTLRCAQEAADFVEANMPLAPSFQNRYDLLKASLAAVKTDGLYCEFGVYRGLSINFIASLVKQEVHGFDSFEGLPEDWRGGYSRGMFKMSGLPRVAGNVRLHKGWFEESVPVFKSEHSGPLAFVHIDSDVYSSSKTVFCVLGDWIVPGTVIQLDEFFNYPGWRHGEFKALAEFVSAFAVELEFIGYTRNDEQVAVRIRDIRLSDASLRVQT